MATQNAETFPFEKLHLARGTAPATPDAGELVVYADDADGLVKQKDEDGTVTPLGGDEGGASAAEDVSITDAGDYFSSTDVEGALQEVGAAVAAAGSGPAGTSFPGSPSVGERFWRTDLGLEFYYDGTRWLSVDLHEVRLIPDSALPLTSTVAARAGVPILVGADIWLVKTQTNLYVYGGGSALSGSHKWVGTLLKSPAGTTLDTVTIDSGASAVFRQSTATAIDALLGSTNFEVDMAWTKTGTPGPLLPFTAISYRHVAT
jgi:hypothetical protein